MHVMGRGHAVKLSTHVNIPILISMIELVIAENPIGCPKQ